MDSLFFNGWEGLLRTGVISVLAYAVLVAFLRVSGKRTLSKMNAFDLVVTVALGSTLATILLDKDVPLAEGALAFGMLIGMQFVVTWTSVRTRWVRKLVTGEPTLLVLRGQPLPSALRRCRITEDELHAAVRETGLSGLAHAQAVVLETDGSMSVVHREGSSTDSMLAGTDRRSD